jgi:hypothetical protein
MSFEAPAVGLFLIFGQKHGQDWANFPSRIAYSFHKMERAMTMIDRVFLDHPRSAGESYAEHMSFAAGFAVKLFLASAAAFIHSLVPCFFPAALELYFP